jgi:hypothetical protein
MGRYLPFAPACRKAVKPTEVRAPGLKPGRGSGRVRSRGDDGAASPDAAVGAARGEGVGGGWRSWSVHARAAAAVRIPDKRISNVRFAS